MAALQSSLATPTHTPEDPWPYHPGVAISGDSGFHLCPESLPTDLLEIEHMEIVPSPPVISEYVNIEVYGTYSRLRHIFPENPGVAFVSQFES